MTRLASQTHLLFAGKTLPVLASWALKTAVCLIAWDHRHRSRKALSSLNEHLLRDIGFTQSLAHKEASKPFWKG